MIMINKIKVKNVFWVIFLGLLCTILLSSYWFEWKQSYNNISARVDIFGLNLNSEIVADVKGINITYPDWCKKEKSKCAVIYFPIEDEYLHYGVKIKNIADKKIDIILRCPDGKAGSEKQKVLVDYKEFVVDYKLLFSETVTLGHDEPHKYIKENIKDDTVVINFYARKHSFILSDIYNLYGDFYEINFIKLLISFILSVVLISCIIKFFYKYGYESVFISVISIFLLCQLITISSAEISEQENRTLNKFPKIFIDSKVNSNFGVEFNNWINDHIGCREYLIDLHFGLMYKLNGKIANNEAFVGDDGWMFETKGIKYVDSLEKQQKKIKTASKLLKRFADRFINNASLYILILPDRNELLEEYWKKYYPPKPKLNVIEELKKELSDYSNIYIYDINKQLKKENLEHSVWEKTGVHLNSLGYLVLDQKIFDIFDKHLEIKKYDVKLDIEKTYIDGSERGEIAKKLNISPTVEKALNINVKLNIEDASRIEIETKSPSEYSRERPRYIHEKRSKALIKKTAFFYGPCYIDHVYDVFSPLFRESLKIRPNSVRDMAQYLTEKTKELFLIDNETIVIMVIDLDLLYVSNILPNALN